MRQKNKIYILILLGLILNQLTFSENYKDIFEISSNYQNDTLISRIKLNPQMVGVSNDEIYSKSAAELDSIRLYDNNANNLKIDSFQLVLYTDFLKHSIVDSFQFKGNIAPNIFTKFKLYRLNENNIEECDLDGFTIKAFYSDTNQRIYESEKRLIYFSVKRTCVNGTVKQKNKENHSKTKNLKTN